MGRGAGGSSGGDRRGRGRRSGGDPDRLVETVAGIVELLAAGDYAAVAACTNERWMTATELRAAVEGLGVRLAGPPADLGRWLAVSHADGPGPLVRAVSAPLWSVDGGAPRLRLELTLTEYAPGVYLTEIDYLRGG